ncbi:MAG: NAD(P)-dependent oxidoreductase [Lachnospiraceae bacterium]|nr:NAD(P)-dependent oxidoreductase [Lachnospiraceae bacterium]
MILVVGATGYVGRYLCPYLVKQGYEVVGLGRAKKQKAFLEERGVKVLPFDLTEEDPFRDVPHEGVEAVINLAACLAELETPVEQFFQVNTIGVYKTLEFARQNGIKKVIVTSSHKVYNEIIKDVISEEDTPAFGGDHTPYIISKIAAEHFVEYYNKSFGLQGIILRLSGVHGYGEILGHLMQDGSYKKSTFEIFFEKALAGDPIEVWGDQSVKRDHVYIKDVIAAIEAAIRAKEAKGIYNIASGIGYSQYEEACVLAKVFSTGKVSEVTQRPDKPGLKKGYVYSIAKAEKELGWKPAYSDLTAFLTDYKKEWISKEYHNYHVFKEGEGPAIL